MFLFDKIKKKKNEEEEKLKFAQFINNLIILRTFLLMHAGALRQKIKLWWPYHLCISDSRYNQTG